MYFRQQKRFLNMNWIAIAAILQGSFFLTWQRKKKTKGTERDTSYAYVRTRGQSSILNALHACGRAAAIKKEHSSFLGDIAHWKRPWLSPSMLLVVWVVEQLICCGCQPAFHLLGITHNAPNKHKTQTWNSAPVSKTCAKTKQRSGTAPINKVCKTSVLVFKNTQKHLQMPANINMFFYTSQIFECFWRVNFAFAVVL